MHEQSIRERMIGASVLVLAAVILLPWMLDGSGHQAMQAAERDTPATSAQLPPRPVAFTDYAAGTADLSAPMVYDAPINTIPTGAIPINPGVEPQTPATQRTPPPAATPTIVSPPRSDPTPRRAMEGWVVQVGSFGVEANAQDQVRQLRAAGHTAFVERTQADGRDLWRVKVGPEAQRERALVLRERLQRDLALSGIVVAHP